MVFITILNTSVSSVAENIPAGQLCTLTSSLLMKIRNISAHCVIIKLQGRVILYNINCQSMKVLSIHANNVNMKQQIRVILQNTFGRCMKVRNISVRFVTRNTEAQLDC